MNQTDAFRAILGVMVLTSAALSAWVSPWWLLMTAFIGLNLLQSAFTRFCGLSLILKKTKLPAESPTESRAEPRPAPHAH